MTDNVASLGFEINSGEIDQAKQKLSGLTTEAGKTEKAVDGLNKSFVGLGSAVKGGAFGSGNANPFDAMTKGITSANTEIEKTAPKLVGMGAAINAAIGKSAVSFNEMKLGVAAANTALDAHKSSVEKAADAHKGLSGQSQAAAHSIRSLIEVIASGGSPIQALTQQFSHLSYAATGEGGLAGAFSGLTRALGPMALGFGALAGAAGIGAGILALEKLNDEIEKSKGHLAGLTGSTEGGARAYDAVKAAAKNAGVEVSALTSAVDAAIIGQETFADKNVQSANTADAVAKKYAEVSASFGTIGALLHGNGTTLEEENVALKALGDSFKSTGKFGVDAFTKIREQSQQAALDIAQIFGKSNVKDFIKDLERMPIPLDEFNRRMAQVDQKVKETLKPEIPKNFEQALRDVKGAAHDVLEELAKAGSFDIFKNILTGAKGEIEAIGHPLDALGKKYKEIAADAKKDWGDFFSITEDDSSLWGGKITVDIDGAIHKIMISLRELSFQPITDFVNGAIAEFKRMAEGAVSAATQAVNALSQIGKGGGGNPAGLSGGGNESNTDATGAVMGGFGGASNSSVNSPQASPQGTNNSFQATPQGTDAAAPGFDLGMADLPAFATGGQFTVTGSGGTDSQVVAFKSTPGETVTVSTPDQMQSSNVQSLTGDASSVPTATATVKEITDAIDASTISISKKVLEGSDAVVAAIKNLSSGVAATTVNPATGLPVIAAAGPSATAAASQNPNAPIAPRLVDTLLGLRGIGALGGGSFTTRQSSDQNKQSQQQRQQQSDPVQLPRSGDSYPYGTIAQGSRVRGAGSGRVSGGPTGRFAPTNPGSTIQPNQAYGGRYPLVDPMNGGAYDSGYPLVDPMAGYDSGPYPSVDPMNSDAYNSPYDYGGNTAYGSNDAGSNYSSDYGGSTGGWFSSLFGGGVTGADTSVMDYGGGSSGGSADYGYFKEGGSFEVGGPEGTDKSLVKLHATKGERVMVIPKGAAPPNGVTVPATTSSSPAAVADSSSSSITNKTINIQVQAGIQAESFIRSRAQIARGF